MSLQLDDELIQFAGTLADAARQVAGGYFRNLTAVWSKTDSSPVTVADIEIEKLLRSMIRDRFPGHGVLGEEGGHDKSTGPWLWVIDPIDGTKSFATGKPTFGCLVALLHKGHPVLGIIDMPALDERWLGVTGQDALYNGIRCCTSTTQELTAASVYATTPDMFSAAELKIFDHLTSHARFRNFGADCYAYALLASGYVDLVMEAGLGQFDFLALAPVVEGAGGSISDWQGEPLSFDSQGQVLASANQELHNKALDLIAAQAAGT